MPQCIKTKFKRRGICAGDLDRLIVIDGRTLTTPKTSVDFEQTFAQEKKVWAALETSKGRQMFFTTNLDVAVTHVFGIRWFAGLDSENWIKYKNELYDIIEVENLDERDEFYIVYCNVRGDENNEVNYD